jgi:branched-chain amino acid transport system ATP-binding protein
MTADAEPAPVTEREIVLHIRSVQMRFGGLLALDGIDLDVAAGERLAILGPNGAGKTTLFNVIAGDLVPTRGSVALRSVDVSALPSRHRPRLGMSRTYQKARSFPGLTVEDNLYLAVVGKEGRHRSLWRSSTDAAWRERARAAAEQVWLADRLDSLVSDLSHGQKRQLEIGMAIITAPEILLLDEPASGLSRGERERLVDLLRHLDENVTLLLIEHDMDVALRVVDRVVVLADGVQIAEGTPEEIQHDPVVLETYLGSADVVT